MSIRLQAITSKPLIKMQHQIVCELSQISPERLADSASTAGSSPSPGVFPGEHVAEAENLSVFEVS